MAILFLAGLIAFVGSCVWWEMSRRRPTAAPAPERPAQLAGGPAIFLVVLGAIEAFSAATVLLYLVAVIFAAAAYLRVGPLALPAIVFAALGVFLGIRLMVRRTVSACRAAAFWYLPIAAFFFIGSVFEYLHRNLLTVQMVLIGAAFFGLFVVMAAPLVPGVSQKSSGSGGQ
jgi:hypothetical protein